jgi:hypothetical protein
MFEAEVDEGAGVGACFLAPVPQCFLRGAGCVDVALPKEDLLDRLCQVDAGCSPVRSARLLLRRLGHAGSLPAQPACVPLADRPAAHPRHHAERREPVAAAVPVDPSALESRVGASYGTLIAVTGLLIGYARFSTTGQDLSPARRPHRPRRRPAAVYVDHGLTALPRPPGLREALAACRAGDTLVVTKLDRLARSVPDARDLVAELTARGVRLQLDRSVQDPTDPVGRLLSTSSPWSASSKPT